MDVRAYFEKLRAIEGQLSADPVAVVSLATVDGGRAGVVMEVGRRVAARMIVEQRVRLATDEERGLFLAGEAKERQESDARSMDARLQFLFDLEQVRRAKPRKAQA